MKLTKEQKEQIKNKLWQLVYMKEKDSYGRPLSRLRFSVRQSVFNRYPTWSVWYGKNNLIIKDLPTKSWAKEAKEYAVEARQIIKEIEKIMGGA